MCVCRYSCCFLHCFVFFFTLACFILHIKQLVVRAFGGEDVTQAEGNTVNPLRDVDTLMAELLKIDQQTASREYRPLETQVEKKQGGTALAADCAAMHKVRASIQKIMRLSCY